MNSERSQKYDDEINLAKLIQSIWEGKWIIFGVTAVVFLMMVTYLKITPQTYTTKLEILPIPVFEASKYKDLVTKPKSDNAKNPKTFTLGNLFTDGYQLPNEGVRKKLKSLFIEDILTDNCKTFFQSSQTILAIKKWLN